MWLFIQLVVKISRKGFTCMTSAATMLSKVKYLEHTRNVVDSTCLNSTKGLAHAVYLKVIYTLWIDLPNSRNNFCLGNFMLIFFQWHLRVYFRVYFSGLRSFSRHLIIWGWKYFQNSHFIPSEIFGTHLHKLHLNSTV